VVAGPGRCLLSVAGVEIKGLFRQISPTAGEPHDPLFCLLGSRQANPEIVHQFVQFREFMIGDAFYLLEDRIAGNRLIHGIPSLSFKRTTFL
jgi:hypothetical protein